MKVRDCKVKMFDGTEVSVNGILDETGTVVAAAVARGSNQLNFTVSQSSRSGLPSRILSQGEVTFYTFNKTGEDDNFAEGEIGLQLTDSKPFRMIQTKSAEGNENDPFVIEPWSNMVRNENDKMSIHESLQKLGTEAINQAVEDMEERAASGKPLMSQEQYNRAARAALNAAKARQSRRYQQQESQSDGAVTADDVV